jgi:hypothetical protein
LLKILLSCLEARQFLLVIVGAFIQALDQDILEEDIVLEIFARGHGECVAGARVCAAMLCDSVRFRIWRWLQRSYCVSRMAVVRAER